MKSLSQWRNQKLYQEFVGPQGQIDPLGATPTPAAPMLAPSPEPEAAQPVDAMGGVGHMIQRVLNVLGNKPTNQIIQAQQHFNTAVQQLLLSKSKSAARRGLNTGFSDFRQARQDFGHQQMMQ